MNADDFLKSLENGDAKFIFDIGKMQLHTLTLAIRNKIYLEHIFNLLHEEDDDKMDTVKMLEELVIKTTNEAFTKIISDTK
jgi:hypothetical protein